MTHTFIRTTLGSLLNVMDARSIVSIYGNKHGEDKLLFNQLHVYEVLTYDGYEELMNCTVFGLSTDFAITRISILY